MSKSTDSVYQATKKLVKFLFQETVESTVFDEYNKGNGIHSFLVPKVIDEAINPLGLCVTNILVEKINGDSNIEAVKKKSPTFALPEKLRFTADVGSIIESPCIVIDVAEQNCEAFTGTENFGKVKMGIYIGTLNK